MNSGIQDAHNLAWKLTAVLNGQAGEELLDTYESERRPVAVHNATQSMVNAKRQQEAARAMASPDFLALLASPEGGDLRASVASGLQDLRVGGVHLFRSCGIPVPRRHGSRVPSPVLGVTGCD
ncbi:FAD-dependent monooxygenase [Streptomyces sp. NPDC002018]|uniref:FAD-dependent monooxygenase n=1 Tax=Streptomyces sp. NPDC002018 TaxID=3364629 RepID=UPI00367AE413